jgi:ATP-binding cassette subfamily B protein
MQTPNSQLDVPIDTGTFPIEKESSGRTFRTLISFLTPHKWSILAGAILGIIATVGNLWTPRIMEYVIEALALGRSTTGYIVAFAIITVLSILALFGQFSILGRAGEVVVYDVREAITARIFRGRTSQVLTHSAGDLVSRVTADAPMLRLAVSSGLVAFVTAITGVVGSIIFMGVIDGLMLGITLSAVVVFTVLMVLLQPKIARERTAMQEAIGKLGGTLSDAFSGITNGSKVDRSLEQVALRRAAQARRHGVCAMLTENASFVISMGGMTLLSVFLLGFGAWRVSTGSLSIAALVAFFMYAMNFMGPLMEIADGMTTISTGLAASKRIAEAQEIEMEPTA